MDSLSSGADTIITRHNIGAQTMSFLQSPEWEAIQRAMGRRTWRVAGSLVIQHKGRNWNYLYSPRPALSGIPLTAFFTELSTLGKDQCAIFSRVDPVHAFFLPQLSVYKGTALQPQATVIIDLAHSEDELLARMHEKTRYNIRLAARKGVMISSPHNTAGKEALERFWNMLQETAVRDGFNLHERRYYETLLDTHSPNFSNEFFFSTHAGTPRSAALINFYKDPESGHAAATYLHGASTNEGREFMASHLLHWEVIREAKRRGVNLYDFWGIDSARWPGVTRFKRGFGGDVVEYPQSFDIIHRPLLYGFYRIAKKIKLRT